MGMPLDFFAWRLKTTGTSYILHPVANRGEKELLITLKASQAFSTEQEVDLQEEGVAAGGGEHNVKSGYIYIRLSCDLQCEGTTRLLLVGTKIKIDASPFGDIVVE